MVLTIILRSSQVQVARAMKTSLTNLEKQRRRELPNTIDFLCNQILESSEMVSYQV